MSNIKRKINSDLDDRMTLDWQGTRAFFYGLGYNDADIEKPRSFSLVSNEKVISIGLPLYSKVSLPSILEKSTLAPPV